VHNFPVGGASIITPCGEERETVKTDGNRVFLVMPKRALRLIKITEKDF